MKTNVSCPRCARKLAVPENFPGGAANCPGCQTRMVVVRLSESDYAATLPTQTQVLEIPSQKQPAEKPQPEEQNRALKQFFKGEVKEKPPDDELEDVPLEPPFLTKTGAVVRCPRCEQRIRLKNRELNKPRSCPTCQRYFVAIAADRIGFIPFDCEHCGYEMEIKQRMAGRTVRCADCNQAVLVPDRPLIVAKLPDPPEPERYQEPQVVSSGPRVCVICGRNLRNPLPFCSKCQRTLRMR